MELFYALIILGIIVVFILQVVTIFTVRFAVPNQATRTSLDNSLIPLYIAIAVILLVLILLVVMLESK